MLHSPFSPAHRTPTLPSYPHLEAPPVNCSAAAASVVATASRTIGRLIAWEVRTAVRTVEFFPYHGRFPPCEIIIR